MNLPGFTAEASLETGERFRRRVAASHSADGAPRLVPAFVSGPFERGVFHHPLGLRARVLTKDGISSLFCQNNGVIGRIHYCADHRTSIGT